MTTRPIAEVVEDDIKPLLRGVTHAYAFWAALAAAIALAILVPPGTPRVASIVYGIGLCALFAASGTYHRWPWNPRWRPILRRIDHSTIFVFIAATYTPVALLVMHGTLRWVILAAVWTGAIGGVVLSVAWITAPRVLNSTCYLALGWVSAFALPQMIQHLDTAPLVLLGVGGLLYTVGAVIYVTKRPDPWPHVFGFHEVFHALVIAAAAVQFVALAGWVFPSAA
jgi:hemolysin III